MSAVTSGASLCISVTFLTGRYHGEEWPPSPSRLFQALLAGLMTCGYAQFEADVEPALRWLERQPPPRIRCCMAEQSGSYRIAVPNNDMDVVAWEWQQGRYKDPAVLKTMKQVSPWTVPEDGPHVQYIWPIDETSEVPSENLLRQATHLLHTLGWGVDMAYADVGQEVRGGDVFEPAAAGELRTIPMAGTLDDLRSAYQRFQKRSTGKNVDSFTRATMLASQPYARAGELYRAVTRFRLLRPEGDKPYAVPWEDCRKVAAWLRHRTAEELRNELPEGTIAGYVQGHADSADGDKSRRISYVPLPTISGSYPDGNIRRALVVEAAGESGQVSRIIHRKLMGAILTGIDGSETCCLAPPEAGDGVFRQYLPESPCRVWRSVTPVVLHGYNTGPRGVISGSKTERLLLRAFSMAGFSDEEIESLSFQSGPLWSGSRHAAAIRVPEHLNGYPRLHVQVRFARPVRGPVLAGIGRHYGIGLFAAVPQV